MVFDVGPRNPGVRIQGNYQGRRGGETVGSTGNLGVLSTQKNTDKTVLNPFSMLFYLVFRTYTDVAFIKLMLA